MSSEGYRLPDTEAPPYVAVVLDRPGMGPDWRNWLSAQLAEHRVVLEPDGSFWDRSHGNDMLGWFRFLERQETETVLQAARIELSARRCPWIDPVQVKGALGWEPLPFRELKSRFVPNLLPLCRGVVIRTRDGAHYEWIRQVTFSMDNLLSKAGGFNEGAAFLDKSPRSEYLRYCCREAQAVLDRAGLEANAYIDENLWENPLLVGELFYKNRKYFRRASEWVLKDLYVTFWAYDWKWYEDDAFWLTEFL